MPLYDQQMADLENSAFGETQVAAEYLPIYLAININTSGIKEISLPVKKKAFRPNW